MTEIATLATTFVMLVCGEKRSRLPRLPRVPHEEIRCWENLGTKRLALPTFIMLVDSGLVRKNCVISPQKVIRIPSMHCELDGNAQGIVNRLLQFLRKRVMNPFF